MRLAVVNEGPVTATETFIRAHAERLPGAVALIHDHPPRVGERTAGRPFFPAYVLRGIARRTGLISHYDHLSRRYGDLLRDVAADIVLAEYGPTAVAVRKACMKVGAQLVVHFHGYDAYRHNELDEYSRNYHDVFRQSRALIAVSSSMREQLVRLGAPEEKVFLNPCGVDTNEFRPANDTSRDRKHFLTVGRFVGKKAPYLSLLAFAKVHEAFPEARLTMVGRGELMGMCQDIACALSISNAVTFSGVQPHKKVREIMGKATALIQHSVVASDGDREGSPVSIMEAGASGLPVVSTYHEGIPEIVQDGKTGFLVEERDVSKMAQKMSQLIEDQKMAKDFGIQARRRIEQHFSMDQSIKRLNDILMWANGNSMEKPPLVPTWISETEGRLPTTTGLAK